MSNLTKWCFKVGVACFVLTVAGQIVLLVMGMDAADLLEAQSTAVRVVGTFLQIFICMGLVLLIEAIMWLKKNWSHLSKSTKVTSTLGLLITSFFGAYVFHWLLPDLQKKALRG
jgi:uncharacterized membrane protein YozB (DUF420 family)